MTGRLLPVLGVGFGLAVTIGNTIGAGILRVPGEVAGNLPVTWLFMSAWLAGGLYAFLGALQLAELGTMIPRSGGQYVFSRYALGPYPGFIAGWTDWISVCGTTAALSMVIGEFSAVLVPSLAGRAAAVAAAVTVVFAAAQWRGIRWGSGIQNVTSLVKTMAFLALAIAAFAIGGASKPPETALDAPTGVALAAAFVVSLQAVIYTYDGWTGPIYFSEEVRNPGREIPRSMAFGVLAIMIIYLLTNAAFLHVLPVSAMAGDALVAATAAKSIFGGVERAMV